MTEQVKAPRRQTDWEAIEPHYRANIRSLKDIGKEYHVSDAGIIKHARKNGWTRDLNAKIQAKADAKVSAAAVSAEVSAQRAANEQTIVEANAEVQYRIRMEHRQDIGRARGLFAALLGEIEAVTVDRQSFDDVLELIAKIVRASDDDPVVQAQMETLRSGVSKLVGVAGRIDNAKKLTEMLERLVKMEREAFGINSDKGDGGGYEDLLSKLSAMGG
ncbi:MAG: hypothetical protein ABI574_00870 [Burkholderiales bacterium]